MVEQINQQEANKALYISGAVIALVVLGLFTNGFGLFNRASQQGNAIAPLPDTGNAPEFVALAIGNAPVLGQESAPVTIYEFSDFACPYCAAAAGAQGAATASLKRSQRDWRAPVPAIKETYIDAGKAKLVFKYFPGHGGGTAGHLVGWCLNEQQPALFWKFHDRIFAEQDKAGSMPASKGIAKELGADTEKLDECVNSGRYTSLLQQDKAMGQSNGVQGTPAFFINGKLITGAQSAEVLEQAIERELARVQ